MGSQGERGRGPLGIPNIGVICRGKSGVVERFAGRETRQPVDVSFHHFPCFFVSVPILPPDLGIITQFTAFDSCISSEFVCPSVKSVKSTLHFGWTSKPTVGYMERQEGQWNHSPSLSTQGSQNFL